MKYLSTRGGMKPLGFSGILLGGLAPDGGLAMPQKYPHLDDAALTRMRGLSYADLAFEILSLFCDDIASADLKGLIDKTYTQAVFGSAEITPLRTIAPGLHVLQLSNGPTLAFKDMAMQLLGNLFEYVLARERLNLNILGATSGDTGSAAEYAMRGKKGVRVFMLSPYGRMSRFQQGQMYSLQDDNIFNIVVPGVFDDCQDMVKAVSHDAAFKSRYAIGTVNSINWARVVAQVVYYFKAYFAATTSNQQRVSFAVPSGNFGNVLAGHIARMMGLPISRLVVATNENNVLDEFFKTGIYRVRSSASTFETSSPSMDISKASNFERFVYDLFGQDAARVKALWRDVEERGVFDVSHTAEFAGLAKFGFVSGTSSHANRMATIKAWSERGVLVDTHTADGLFVAQQYREPDVPMICLETALPVKFSDAIAEATGKAPSVPERFAGLTEATQRFAVMAPDVPQLKHYIRQRCA
jgi:threonine synthase